MLAAHPATPAQLAAACLAAGFAAAVPASWGDELVAAGALRGLAAHGAEPAILGSCPHVVDRLLAAGGDLERYIVPLVAPPVAAARYVRALYEGSAVHITYAGACPSGTAADIDARLFPAQLLARLAERGVQPAAMPDDAPAASHRRFRSLPGGAPAPEPLFSASGRTLQELDGDDVTEELAQRLLARERALCDLGPCMRCACSGAVPECPPHSARAAVAAIEPPRARDEVLDPDVIVDVARSLPRREGAVRAPAAPHAHAAARQVAAEPGPLADRPVAASLRRRFRTSGILRAVSGVPLALRDGDGRALPRAYRGLRQRLTTGRLWAVTPPPAGSTAEREVPRAVLLADAEREVPARQAAPGLVVPLRREAPYRVPPPPPDIVARVRFAVGVALLIVAVALWLL